MAEDPVVSSSLSISDDIETVEDGDRCVKLNLPTHIAAFLKQEELYRDFQQIICDQSLLENITSNYVIVKKILSFLPWQEKLACKNVCSMWRSTINTLQKEQLGPSDFAVSLRLSHIMNGIKLIQSEVFLTEPMVVLAFANTAGFSVSRKCQMLIPCPCDPPCEKEHCLVDVIKNLLVVPKKCMLTVKASYLSYMPLQHSLTYQHSISQKFGRSSAFIAGMYIPMLPNVEFNVINLKCLGDLKRTFFKKVDKLSDTRYIKGALVFVNESFLLHSVEDIVFLNYLRVTQPNVPYALGGCIVEDTLSDKDDMDSMIEGINSGVELVSGNLVSIGLFTIPRDLNDTQPDHGCNFDVFSLIIESSEWSKAKIQAAINEFSRKVPHFEHSVAIKLSCVGRDKKHDYEQDAFRAAFPNTRIVGCYGNGELGVNRPQRPQPEVHPSTVKRHRRDPGPQYGVMYSYATVFLYIGWGKIITPPAESS